VECSAPRGWPWSRRPARVPRPGSRLCDHGSAGVGHGDARPQPRDEHRRLADAARGDPGHWFSPWCNHPSHHLTESRPIGSQPVGISTSVGKHPSQVRGRHPRIYMPVHAPGSPGMRPGGCGPGATRDGSHARQGTPPASWSSPAPAADFLAADTTFLSRARPREANPTLQRDGRANRPLCRAGRSRAR